MKSYHKNPRKITPAQLDQLRRNMQELGDLSGIVHDEVTDEIISGNQRSAVIDINNATIVIMVENREPDEQGTIALGYVMWQGQQFSYRRVRWTDEQREKANITANSLGGDWDWEILQAEFDPILLTDWGLDLPAFDDEKPDVKYSTKIKSPIYEPADIVPKISELYNNEKAEELSKEIKQKKLPKDVELFLLEAAKRHVSFHYGKIADYYAAAPADVQRLMERSALVIIDFKQAIEQGYVKLTDDIKTQYLDEYGNEA